MRSTTLSCLLILGLKRCMLCCLPVYGGHTREFLVSKSVSLVRFVKLLHGQYTSTPRIAGTITHC